MMTLRKSFFKVTGFPNRDHHEWGGFIERYAPNATGNDEEQFVDAWHEYLADRYQDLSFQDARLRFLNDARYVGDLSFRDEPTNSADVIEAAKEFRESCRWWMAGERETKRSCEDAQDFTLWVNEIKHKHIDNVEVKREVELSLQFANALQVTAEETGTAWLEIDRVASQRRTFFLRHLDHAFS